MEDLIVVGANCPEEEQIKALEDCITSLIDFGYHIILVSHTHIPLHLQKKCNYYFFDYLNDTSDSYDFLEHNSFTFDNGDAIYSRFFNKYFYGFAIYRMISIASQVARIFNYKNLHYLEYDTKILNKEILIKHSDLLKEHDYVFYTDNGKNNGKLLGFFNSFRVDKLPHFFLNYNKKTMEETIKKSSQKYLEAFTLNLLLSEGKCCILHKQLLSDDKIIKGRNFINRNNHYTLFYDPKSETLNIFFNNTFTKEQKITLNINNSYVISFNVKPFTWHLHQLGIFDEIFHVKIDDNTKIIYSQNFDAELREIYKIKSYIKYSECS